MNHADFDKVFEDQVQACRNVLLEKGKEYATNDRLHNFKVASALRDVTPEDACGGFLAKHVVSIYDLIAQSGDFANIPMEKWNEKIGDALNYLFLLKAIVVERDRNEALGEIKKGGMVFVTNVEGPNQTG